MTRDSVAALAIIYVGLALAVDVLASQSAMWVIDWGQLDFRLRDVHGWLAQFLPAPYLQAFSWLQNPDLQRFDVYKFLFWLVIPFMLCLPGMEWSWLSWRGWRAADWVVVLLLALAGMLAMLLIPEVPALRERYPAMSLLPLQFRLDYLTGELLWILSWLLGYEFLHRYVLLRAGSRLWPGWGWLIVPLSEGLYHLQKPLLETAGVVLLSLILTQWAMRRGNLLLPLLVHLIIEIELLIFLLFV